MYKANCFMQKALALAEKGRYSVAPNPMVGCIIERNGNIVGSGWHKKAGLPHAEILALKEAGDQAKGANVYVTLEPCCHYGKTPPCVDALIAAQVKSVHIPFIDPNPLVNGHGVDKLQNVGIEVYIGEEEEVARQQNEVFLHYMTTKLPYVVAKWAMTLDGRIAADSGNSKWITDVNARTHVHYSRCWLGAVLVGSGTVITDNPQLTPYLIKKNDLDIISPVRIVLDSKGKLPLSMRVFNSSDKEKVFVATTQRSSKKWREDLTVKNINVLILPENKDGEVDLNSLLDVLGKLNISGILVEGGTKIFTSFFAEKLVNCMHVYIAPKLVGGNKLNVPLRELNLFDMDQAIQLNCTECKSIGQDIFIAATPKF